jgi:F-type H+-transporting ATPase subunit delta
VIIDRVSTRYALSLYDLAVERNEVQQVLDDFRTLDKAFAQSRELVLFLQNPIISGLKKLATLRMIFHGKVEDDTYQLIELLARKGRESLLPGIVDEFIALYRRRNHIQPVRVTSATPLSAAQVESIRTSLAKKLNCTVELTTDVDASLIGGFKVDFGNSLFDGSVAYAIRRVEKELMAQFAN